MQEPGEPARPQELPGKMPDEFPGRGPNSPTTPNPATDRAGTNWALNTPWTGVFLRVFSDK